MLGTCGSPIARGVMCVRVRIVTSSCWLVVGALVLALTIACGDASTDRIEPSTPPSVDSTGKPIPTRTPVPTRTLLPTSATGPTSMPTDDEQPSAHGIMTPIPTRTPVRTPTPLPSGITGATPIPKGGGQLHPSQLTTVAPQPASPGSQITVTGTGGYIKITGGYIEGSRQFHLYFDEQLIGTIWCMMNACRATARIPEDATPGEHKFSAEGGSSITVTVE